MRRKPGALLPVELAICTGAMELRNAGTPEFHGYQLAKRLADGAERRSLTAYGTLYRALGRLEQMGLLESRWEAPDVPAREKRPGRRLYTLTSAGMAAIRDAERASRAIPHPRTKRRLVPA